MIRPAEAPDAASLARLYKYYGINSVITFEEDPVTAEDKVGRKFGRWIDVGHRQRLLV